MPNSRIYFGNTGGAPPVVNDNTVIEFRTLTGAEIIAKKLTLVFVPSSALEVCGWVNGGNVFLPTVDFTLAVNVLDWSLSSYDGLLVAGDIIEFIYKKV
jgi:hypothetical protein